MLSGFTNLIWVVNYSFISYPSNKALLAQELVHEQQRFDSYQPQQEKDRRI